MFTEREIQNGWIVKILLSDNVQYSFKQYVKSVLGQLPPQKIAPHP